MLEGESGLNDPPAVLAVTLLSDSGHHPPSPALIAGEIAWQLAAGAAIGILAGVAGADSAACSVPSGDSPASSAGSVSSPAPKKKSSWYRIGGGLLGVALVVLIFLEVIPQFASHRGAWTAIQKMGPGWSVAILVAAVLIQVSAVWPYQAVLPHLRFWHGFMETQTSTAVSTTVPAGGAVALGITFRMFGSFGFSDVAITSAVATTGIWNLGFKFGLPIVAVVLVAVTGHDACGAVGVALLGVLLIAVCGTTLWLVFRDAASARRIGRPPATPWPPTWYGGPPPTSRRSSSAS
jgi:hypothetical protein